MRKGNSDGHGIHLTVVENDLNVISGDCPADLK